MKYTMEAGVLYQGKTVRASLKGVFTDPEKEIFAADGTLALRTGIRGPEAPQGGGCSPGAPQSGAHSPEAPQGGGHSPGTLRGGARSPESSRGSDGGAHFRQYVIYDRNGNVYASAEPAYDVGNRPEAEWPGFRTVGTNQAKLLIGGQEFCLIMQNSQNYYMEDGDGKTVLKVLHRGLAGGWDIESADGISPEMACGIFVFCRYLEQENEFLAV